MRISERFTSLGRAARTMDETDATAHERRAAMASYQYVYHMQGLTKSYPGGKMVLENVHLSFYPTAKPSRSKS